MSTDVLCQLPPAIPSWERTLIAIGKPKLRRPIRCDTIHVTMPSVVSEALGYGGQVLTISAKDFFRVALGHKSLRDLSQVDGMLNAAS
eukprot:6488245-Amphidinium_carterae.2